MDFASTLRPLARTLSLKLDDRRRARRGVFVSAWTVGTQLAGEEAATDTAQAPGPGVHSSVYSAPSVCWSTERYGRYADTIVLACTRYTQITRGTSAQARFD